MEAQFRDARIVLDGEGGGSWTIAGQAHQIELEIAEETASYMKLRFKDSPGDDSMIYDKSDRSLMMPTKLELPNSSGILPTYFHRRR